MKIELKQIGIIHSPFKTKEETPIQPFKSEVIGRVKVFKDFYVSAFDRREAVRNGWLEGKL